MIYEDLKEKKKKLAVVGLGYVGLPIALELAKNVSVIGYDISSERVKMMQNHIDPSNELSPEDFEGADIEFTDSIDKLREASFYVVAVPTPVDDHNVPNLKPLLNVSETLGQVVEPGDYVVFESTVYPGCTEEDCIPLIEEGSGLKFPDDFKVGYSPERINPGDKVNTIRNVNKIVSGCDEESLDNIAKVYELVVTDADVHRAPNIKVAEAAKIIENTQRDLNIALMNELSIIFHKIGINTYDVIDAAATKWNFNKYYPGLVGGHCISVDPYYLIYKSEQLGYKPHIIKSGRHTNDEMPKYIAKQAVKHIISDSKDPKHAKVLIYGITFKENVSDIRNSKIANLAKELISYNVNPTIVDPHADKEEVMEEYGLHLSDKIDPPYDVVIAAVSHDDYADYTEEDFKKIMEPNGLLIDVKGTYRDKIKDLDYFSL